jgi:cellulose synthase/poly-beta-1,6-N-acetylglucosamine synthase-like glycosyltransferase
MTIIFWISIVGLLFIYVGYGLVIMLVNKIKLTVSVKKVIQPQPLPTLAVLIAAYNEEDIIKEKILNTQKLDYPKDKIKIYVVSDGSTDMTNAVVSSFKDVTLFFSPARKGKSAAVNRAMKLITEDITVFTDANVMINSQALLALVSHYQDDKVGAVSGEKVVLADERAAAASTEGLYWRYESFLKKQDAQLSSLVGAAGEMFSVRTALFDAIAEDTLLDDFIISMNIIRKGYSVKYEPLAMACEKPSSDIAEEYKRKVRISAGGIQTVLRTLDISDPFRYGIVSFQYLVHRVSRWTIAPVLILSALVSNLFLIGQNKLYVVTILMQLLFHSAAVLGFYLNLRKRKVKMLHVPFYFDFMHYCVVVGWIRYAMGNQKATWQKATRLSYN